jgi:protein-L-isoaspartate O-methyltransferase
MKNQMDYKAIEAQLIDNVISVEEFDKLLEYAKVNDGRDGKDQEVKTVDSD